MLKKEWQAILKNKFFIVIIIALMTIPALYNLIFLSSMWDPYGKISDLPVAVVNQDQSAEINGKSVNLGKDLADEMAKGNDLDYHFVSDSMAQKGLKDETYFMEIKIPSDFSKNAGSLVSDKPTSSTIHYQTSKGHNFIASKMSDSAMEKLKEKVSKNITETYTKTIFENLTTLASGVTKAADGSDQLVDGSQTLKSGSSDISSNLDKLATSSLTFKDGADTLNVGIGQYMAGVSTLKDGSASLSQAVTQYTDGAAQLANGTNQLATGTASLAAGVSQLSNSNPKIQELLDGSAALSKGLQKMSGSISVPDLSDLKTGLANLQNEINTIQNANLPASLTTDLAYLNTALGTLETDQATKLKALRATNAYKSHPEEQATLEGLVSPSPSLVKNIKDAATDLQIQISSLSIHLGTISAISGKVLPGANVAIDRLTGSLTIIKTGVDGKLLPGANLVNVGLTKLVDGVNSASDGANKLNQSTAQINTGAQTLIGNNTQLNAGSSKLATGAAQLTQNSPKLLDGSAQLASGAAQISGGSGRLASGSNTLTSGIGTLTAGATTLNTGLTDAKTKLAENATAEANAKKIASPLNITHQDKDNSPKNGVGMAPYMISVALFVGAVATNMIISGTLSGESPKSRRDYLLARIGVNGLIGLGEGVLVYLAVHLLGLSANHELAMFGFTVLVAVCFMFIVTFFNTWLGKPGAFLMLILLLLQLGASAGTYPLALTSNFFQRLNPWMPMTYAVKGFRQVISLTGQIGQETGILLAITVVCFILLSFVGYRKAKA
ncbi:MAG: YhgE/Pip domain-containing protein [Lactococcus sp.]|uniref:Phage infection protein YhgE n=1 Tax=Pseudolactococcus piscium MKFS47 TaxID=297352 RepID=A0A0D6DXT6_9LACT|nr:MULTISPECIES: YhgE/Pip domain-containing protein [Lactococcus]MDN5409088.1 YhgE/Pip domain-containing protein [Lactococcus sp.]MDN5410976.1 YhgE/Pip domain-containing protein [Lactococcus sp.]MDN5435697.1 YhgE/Pip domain-containing protein [Lactococcus sp.]MDN5492095.1 YhgE/Pip domain-containing protein [Lactococcus sp.]MDN6523984.1 YhgE/Pip domain-containing protein [Lactococcus sp.]